MPFSNILPDPNYEIGLDGELDATYRDGIGFASVKLNSNNPIMGNRSPSSRIEKDEAYHHLWDISISYNPMTCEQFHPIFAFLLEMQTTLQPFYVSLPNYYSQTTADMDSFNSYSRGANILLLNDTGAQQGELFNFIGKSKVYMITRVETNTNYLTHLGAPGSGLERVHISPSLQEDITNGDILTFEKPLIKVIQVGETLSYNLKKNNLFSFSIQLQEVRT